VSEIILIFLALATGTWMAASVGAAMIVFVKKETGQLFRLVFGFAAGVILMVSFVELLHPAIHRAEAYSALPAWVIVPGGFVIGFISVLLLDKCISNFKAKKEGTGGGSFKYRQSLILLSALSAHNLPEGFALGILLGALGNRFHIEELVAFIPLIIAIGLHKLPEGTAISVSFRKDGMSKFKSFICGQISGFVGFLSGVVGFLLAVNINAILPYAMAFAGGAMVWVAIHELIPESRKNNEKSPYLATVGVILGVLLMLLVDTTLHKHHHGHHHGCHQHGCHHQINPVLFESCFYGSQ